jgi:hypothetical protein
MIGSGYPMGTSTPPGWAAQQIVFLQLTSSAYQYSYLSGSGIVTGDIDITTFIESVVNGSQEVNVPLPSGTSAPNIVLTVPCYVVVQLDSRLPWAFQPSAAPMLTQNNLATKYCALNLVDASGKVYAATAPATPACGILYFSVVSVAPASQGVSDQFSYYFQITQSDGGSCSVILDPALKNNGGPP